jgi:glycosyltransferase involved in cell wall biosynthesis
LERHWLAAYRNIPTVTLSASSKCSLEEYGLCNVNIVPAGMDVLPELVKSDPLEKEDTLTFAFVGRLASNKRPDHAIEAFRIVHRQFSGARLWIMGTGPMEGKLRSRAPDGVEFLGRVSDAEKHDRLRRAHALLVTSVREGWGLVVTEAAAVGTPSFGYNVAGLCDSISVSGGVLTDENPAALASTLLSEIAALVDGTRSVSPAGVTTWPEVANGILAVGTGAVFGPAGARAWHERLKLVDITTPDSRGGESCKPWRVGSGGNATVSEVVLGYLGRPRFGIK